MDEKGTRQPLTSEARLAAYLDAITAELGHASRAASAQAYCTGLLLPGERKSVEPMAARLDPAHVQAKHQSLHHVVAQAEWDDAALLATVRAAVLPALERHGPVAYWIVDDSGFPKQGTPSVGVARQYCGQLGKPDNCQVAVSLSVANDHASLPIAYQLFLPEVWADDPARQGGRAGGDQLRNQDRDRARATSPGAGCGRAGRDPARRGWPRFRRRSRWNSQTRGCCLW